MLSILSKEPGKAYVKAMMSWTIAVEAGLVISADFNLRGGLGLVVGEWGAWALRACWGRGGDEGSCLHCDLLIVVVAWSLKCTDLAVFLKPQGGWCNVAGPSL